MPRHRRVHDLTDEELVNLIRYYERRLKTTTSEDRKLRAARAVRDYRAEQDTRRSRARQAEIREAQRKAAEYGNR